jgi:hypothetical protein
MLEIFEAYIANRYLSEASFIEFMRPMYKNLHIVDIDTTTKLVEAAYNRHTNGEPPCHLTVLEQLPDEHARILHTTLCAIPESDAVLFLLPLAESFFVALYTKSDRTVVFVNARYGVLDEATPLMLNESFRHICRPLQQNKILKMLWFPRKSFCEISATYLLPITFVMLRLGNVLLPGARSEIEKHGTATLQQQLHEAVGKSWPDYCEFRKLRYVLVFANFLAQEIESTHESYLAVYGKMSHKKRESLFERWHKALLKNEDSAPWLPLDFAETQRWMENLEVLMTEMATKVFERIFPDGLGRHLSYKAAQQESPDPAPLLYGLAQDQLLAWREYFIKH